MRGCLTFLVVVALVVGVGGWFLLPPAAGALVGTGLAVSGLRGTDTKVAVTADPPYELLGGHADGVTITSNDATWGELQAASLEIDLTSVGLVDRTFKRIDGVLTGVRMTDSGGNTLGVTSVTLNGTRDQTTASLAIGSAAVQLLLARALADALPATPDKIELEAPDRIVITAAGQSIVGRLAIDTGNLVLRLQGLGTVPIYRPAGGSALKLRSVAVAADEVTLGTSIDLAALGFGA